MSTRNTVIRVSSLTKTFGDLNAIDDISFKVTAGEIVGFVGPNGAGKSTTIGTIMGFLHPTHGKIHLFGEPVDTDSAYKNHQYIGYVAGDMALLDNLSGEQYLDHMAALVGSLAPHRKRLIEQLDPVLNKRLKTLSRGNKQKIALIAALQHEPKLLILDEPTTGLDPLMQETFLKILSREAKKGMTVFMSSHILSEVATVCERVIFMKSGKIILDEQTKKIEQQAGKEITISADKKIIATLLRQKPSGVGNPEKVTEKSMVFLHKGDISTVLKWLSPYKLDDVTIRDRDFDNIFHSMYEQEDVR